MPMWGPNREAGWSCIIVRTIQGGVGEMSGFKVGGSTMTRTLPYMLLLASTVQAVATEEMCWPSWQFTGPEVTAESTLKEIWVDTSPFTGVSSGDTVIYDPELATHPVGARQLPQQPDWVVGVRLVLSEVGPDRLLANRYGLLEAVGILQTVHNRLDPAVYNPGSVPGITPWPGCGEGGSFNTCANPGQYYGLRYRRALDPRSVVRDPAELTAAVEVAISAWWLVSAGVVPDVTGGATSFVHRCGGAAYDMATLYCDGSSQVPDVVGAVATKGPLAFKGPRGFLRSRGRYRIVDTRRIDYRIDPSPLRPGEFSDYIWGHLPTSLRSGPVDG